MLFVGAQHPSRTADGSLVSHKMWTRMVMVLCVSLIIYWSQGHDHVTIMAKQSEVISPKRFQNFLCAPSYKKQIVDAGNPGKKSKLNAKLFVLPKLFWIVSS